MGEMVVVIMLVIIGIASVLLGAIGLADSMTRTICPKCKEKSMIVKNIKIIDDHAVYSYHCEECGYEEDKVVEFS